MPPGVRGDEVHDLRPLVLTPGLIDAHVHLGLFARADLQKEITQAMDSGLAAVRDGGDRDGRTLDTKNRRESRLLIAASGQALHQAGRYGKFLGRPVSDREDINELILSLRDKGAAQIKIIASGPVNLEEFGKVGPPQFNVRLIKDIVDRAGDFGLKVMAHANGPEAVRAAVQAGAASVEHGYFMGPANLELMAEKGTFWVPTITPLAVLAGKEDRNSRRLDIIKRTVGHQLEQLALAREMGVRIGLGTDAGSPGVGLGSSLRDEISWMLKAGFSGPETLAMATAGNADLIGFTGRLGRLTPGHLAFIAGFSGDAPWSEALLDLPLFVGRPEHIHS